MKLNLGSGKSKFEGFINVDDDTTVNPDYLINLDDIGLRLPFDDDSVDEIKAHHVLEHIGSGFMQLMREIYRVAKNGCIIDIVGPNERHDVFFGDPTHVRPINVNIFYTLSKDHEYGYLGRKNNINFEVVDFSFNYDSFYIPLIKQYHSKKEAGILTSEEDFFFQRVMRESNNVVIENNITVKVVK